MTERPHDAIFKAGFEKPEHASGIFRALLPAPLRDAIAWETARAEHGSFIDPALADSHSDLLFSVQLGGRPAFLYLLLEHQSTSDSDMPLRVLAYMVRIWERFRSEHARERVRRPLPPILPAVISHVPGGWTTARSFDDLLDPAPSSTPGLAEFVPRFSLLIEDLAHLSNDAIKSRTSRRFPSSSYGRYGTRVAGTSSWRTSFTGGPHSWRLRPRHAASRRWRSCCATSPWSPTTCSSTSFVPNWRPLAPRPRRQP